MFESSKFFTVIPVKRRRGCDVYKLESLMYRLMNTLTHKFKDVEKGETVRINVSRTKSNKFFEVMLEECENAEYCIYPVGLPELVPDEHVVRKVFILPEAHTIGTIEAVSREISDFLRDESLLEVKVIR